MTSCRFSSSVVIGLLLLSGLPARAAEDKQTAKVYGEWRILVKCDKGPEYEVADQARGAAAVSPGRRTDGGMVEDARRQSL